jgi:hypothetical protein
MIYPMTPSMARAYQESLLLEAKRGRPVKGPLPTGPRFVERLLLRLGDLLISLGTRLRTRYEPNILSGSERYGKARA